MQTKLVKSLIAGTIGAALSAISLYGMNPAGMAAYGAIQGSSLMAVPSIPLFLIAIYCTYGFIGTFKYAIVMFLSTVFIVTVKCMDKEKKRTGGISAGVCDGGILCTHGCGCVYG